MTNVTENPIQNVKITSVNWLQKITNCEKDSVYKVGTKQKHHPHSRLTRMGDALPRWVARRSRGSQDSRLGTVLGVADVPDLLLLGIVVEKVSDRGAHLEPLVDVAARFLRRMCRDDEEEGLVVVAELVEEKAEKHDGSP